MKLSKILKEIKPEVNSYTPIKAVWADNGKTHIHIIKIGTVTTYYVFTGKFYKNNSFLFSVDLNERGNKTFIKLIKKCKIVIEVTLMGDDKIIVKIPSSYFEIKEGDLFTTFD